MHSSLISGPLAAAKHGGYSSRGVARIFKKGFYIPFAGKSLQIYNEFVLTVSRLNRDTNNSLAAVLHPSAL